MIRAYFSSLWPGRFCCKKRKLKHKWFWFLTDNHELRLKQTLVLPHIIILPPQCVTALPLSTLISLFMKGPHDEAQNVPGFLAGESGQQHYRSSTLVSNTCKKPDVHSDFYWNDSLFFIITALVDIVDSFYIPFYIPWIALPMCLMILV